jgi:hypothetical protein
MSWPSVLGLPLHPLIVHATVVLVPLAAVAVLPRLTDPLLNPVVIGVLAVVAVVGTTQQVVRIGHSGAEAAWHGVASSPSGTGSDGDGDGR